MILRTALVSLTVAALLLRSVLVSEREPRISQEITWEEVEQQLPKAIDPVFASEPGRVAWGKRHFDAIDKKTLLYRSELQRLDAEWSTLWLKPWDQWTPEQKKEGAALRKRMLNLTVSVETFERLRSFKEISAASPR